MARGASGSSSGTRRIRCLPRRSRKPAAQDRVPDAPGERRPVAMTPYAIAVALFAAFVVGGILAKAVPLWLVAVIGLAIGAAVFVFVDRYPRIARIR